MSLSALACATGFFLPQERRTGPRVVEAGFWQTLDWPFAVWMGAMMLHWLSFAPYNYGFSLYLREQNVAPQVTGALWSVGVLSEVLTFAACGWVFKRFGTSQVLFFAFATTLMRWILLGMFPRLPVIIATQLLHGPAFALYYSACMQILSTRCRGRFRSSYQGLFATMVTGLATCLGTALAGWLHGHMAFHAVILCMLPFEAGALLLLWSTRHAPFALPVQQS